MNFYYKNISLTFNQFYKVYEILTILNNYSLFMKEENYFMVSFPNTSTITEMKNVIPYRIEDLRILLKKLDLPLDSISVYYNIWDSSTKTNSKLIKIY